MLQCYFIANDCYTSGRTITPKGVMVHSTGANNPKLARYVQPVKGQANYNQIIKEIGTNKNHNDWNNPGLNVCTHAFIGKKANGTVDAVQTLPWNRRGWHAGTGTSGGTANNTHIAFEICEDGLDDPTYFSKAYSKAVELTAMLCKTYKLNPLADGVVICHSEGYQRGIASNHGDVMHWFPKFGKSMDTFRSDVAKAMGNSSGGGSTNKPGTGGNSGSQSVSYTVRVSVSDLRIRSGPGTDYKSNGFIKPGVYTIVAESSGKGANRWGKLKSGAGWIALDFVTKLGEVSNPAPPAFSPYRVKISVTELRIRSGPGTNTEAKGFIKPGVYTIVAESNGPGAKKWGKLKSGAGWIALDYATKC